MCNNFNDIPKQTAVGQDMIGGEHSNSVGHLQRRNLENLG